MSKVSYLAGFTLIELVIVSGLLVFLMLAVSTMFVTSIDNAARTHLSQVLKNEGESVRSVMEFLLRNSTNLTANAAGQVCTSGMSSIRLRSVDGGETELSILGSQISSNSAHLTSTAVTPSDLKFDCSKNSSGNRFVDYSFTLTRGNFSQEFTGFIQLRNK